MKEGNMDAVKLEGGPSVLAAMWDHSLSVTDLRSSLSAAGSDETAFKPQPVGDAMTVLNVCTGNLNMVRPLLQVGDPTEQRLSVLWWSLALR